MYVCLPGVLAYHFKMVSTDQWSRYSVQLNKRGNIFCVIHPFLQEKSTLHRFYQKWQLHAIKRNLINEIRYLFDLLGGGELRFHIYLNAHQV